MDEIKAKLIDKILADLDEKILATKSAIDSTEESKLNETKSTAGDKYETGRAMMQLEQEKLEAQLSKLVESKKHIQLLPKTNSDQAQVGSLVLTDQLNYFISRGLGKIVLSEGTYFAVSASSPIGIELIGKSVGQIFDFRGKRISITHIS